MRLLLPLLLTIPVLGQGMSNIAPNTVSVTATEDTAIGATARKAENGDVLAQFKLGFAYYKGIGLVQDIAQSIRWFQKAAEQGHPDAQFNLGVAYKNGEGVPKNPTESVYWFRRAAEQGDAGAQFFLGLAYYRGEGVLLNQTEAVSWFRKAAVQGFHPAQHFLGFAYSQGKGVPQDRAESLKWIISAAENGNPEAQENLGQFYKDGAGFPKDYQESVRWFRRSAELGNPKAQYALALFYALGEGSAKNVQEAYVWSSISLSNGYQDALELQDLLSKGLSPSELKNAQARVISIREEIKVRMQSPENTFNPSAKSWIALGNECFDTNQYQRAIDAYNKALELDPKNPDVITDQGTMYFELGAYDKAKYNFILASQINPHHLNSLYNLGILYLIAYKDKERAQKIWGELISIAPGSEKAIQAQAEIEKLKITK